jgi:2,4-dienoyl-CoA reductase (NADPH2)
MWPTVTGFPHLPAPGRVGAVPVRVRIVMSRMATMYAARAI